MLCLSRKVYGHGFCFSSHFSLLSKKMKLFFLVVALFIAFAHAGVGTCIVEAGKFVLSNVASYNEKFVFFFFFFVFYPFFFSGTSKKLVSNVDGSSGSMTMTSPPTTPGCRRSSRSWAWKRFLLIEDSKRAFRDFWLRNSRRKTLSFTMKSCCTR